VQCGVQWGVLPPHEIGLPVGKEGGEPRLAVRRRRPSRPRMQAGMPSKQACMHGRASAGRRRRDRREARRVASEWILTRVRVRAAVHVGGTRPADPFTCHTTLSSPVLCPCTARARCCLSRRRASAPLALPQQACRRSHKPASRITAHPTSSPSLVTPKHRAKCTRRREACSRGETETAPSSRRGWRARSAPAGVCRAKTCAPRHGADAVKAWALNPPSSWQAPTTCGGVRRTATSPHALSRTCAPWT